MNPDRGERGEIEAALCLVLDLVTTIQELKAIYLDFGFGKDEMDESDEELRRNIEHLADPTRKRKVEIVWEDNGWDFCGSLVSREFWKRSKEIKEKQMRDQ